MPKVIKVDNEFIFIVNEDKSTRKIPRVGIEEELAIGDEVQVYQIDNEVIINKINSSSVTSQLNNSTEQNISPQQGQMQQHIVINNVSNSNMSTRTPNTVNKVSYLLITFFLGGFGIHKFYAGKVGLGILYLIFFWTWIPSIVALIEFIIAICKTADEQGNIEV